MIYRVVYSSRARLEINQAAIWWAENRSIDQAGRWLEGFQAAIASLAENPDRCALASESHAFTFQLRQLLYGLSGKPTHRALFRVRGDLVEVLAVRHVAQYPLTPDEFG